MTSSRMEYLVYALVYSATVSLCLIAAYYFPSLGVFLLVFCTVFVLISLANPALLYRRLVALIITHSVVVSVWSGSVSGQIKLDHPYLQTFNRYVFELNQGDLWPKAVMILFLIIADYLINYLAPRIEKKYSQFSLGLIENSVQAIQHGSTVSLSGQMVFVNNSEQAHTIAGYTLRFWSLLWRYKMSDSFLSPADDEIAVGKTDSFTLAPGEQQIAQFRFTFSSGLFVWVSKHVWLNAIFQRLLRHHVITGWIKVKSPTAYLPHLRFNQTLAIA